MDKPVNPHRGSGFILAKAAVEMLAVTSPPPGTEQDEAELEALAERVPSAVETLEHLEQTLDNLDPVPTTAPTVGAIADAAADAMINEGGPVVPEGTIA